MESTAYSLLAQIVFFIAAVASIKIGLVPVRYRIGLLVCIVLAASLVLVSGGATWFAIGIRIDNLWQALFLYAPATMAAALILWALSGFRKTGRVRWVHPHFLYFALPLSLAQQFFFQAFLLQRLETVFAVPLAIAVVALLYGFMHTIYPDKRFNMILASGGGVMWAILYTLAPNLIVASLSHAFLNVFAVRFSFFVFPEDLEVR